MRLWVCVCKCISVSLCVSLCVCAYVSMCLFACVSMCLSACGSGRVWMCVWMCVWCMRERLCVGCVLFLIYTPSYLRHDSFICETWRIYRWDMTRSYVYHDSFIYVIWIIHMCDVTHPYVWLDLFINVTLLIYMCDKTHSYVWQWLIHVWQVTTHLFIWHDSYPSKGYVRFMHAKNLQERCPGLSFVFMCVSVCKGV